MMRRALPIAFLASFSLIQPFASGSWGAEKKDAPGLGDPGALQSITIDTGRTAEGTFKIAGRDASQQLIVTGHYASGQVRDLTRKVTYTVAPEGILKIDATGWATPIKEGEATIQARSESGQDATLKVAVTNIEVDVPVNFPNEVVPVFTKFGCNGGGCHGKSGGQNGFALALLGFEPKEDFEHLVKEARGRRLFPAAPDRSLLLLKAAGGLPHGGGQRIDRDSPPYNVIRRWIEQGMPYGSDSDPVVVRIDVLPDETLMEREQQQQIAVVAHFSDGSSKDVTRMTQFDSNDSEMAEVSPTGLVTTGQLTGSVAIMARYQGHVDTFRATVPLGVPADNLPQPKNFIDELVFKKLKQLGLPSSEVCDDSTFLRRVSIDIAGRLPTVEETEKFLIDQDPNKREKAIDELLASTDYAEFFANKWAAILRNKRNNNETKAPTFAFHAWIRQSLHENKPYDQFVREVIASSGDYRTSPGTVWYKEVKDKSAQLEDTAQLFLGLRIQCARCHHHPFEKWSQQDYYGFEAFFSRVGQKPGPLPGNEAPKVIYHQRGVAQSNNPKTGQPVKPTGLGSEPMELTEDIDPRHKLVDWMAEKDNPFFAPALANRYWKHFFGRGLVDPEDDMRVTNPASNPELLAALGKHFIDSGFDMKNLIRTICTSQTYQLSAIPNEWNQDDKQNFSRYFPKRLHAEVLLDAIDELTLSKSRFSGVPADFSAVALPDNAFNSYFLTVFGRPEASSACECERSSDANLAQSLHLLNSQEIQQKVGGPRAQQLAGDKERSPEDKIRELYLVAFSREPAPEEVTIAVEHIKKNETDPKRAYEDIIWALINTKEFLFNH
jgi:hypothetical protein